MENSEFKNIVNNFLIPFGFKRKGNSWRLHIEEIEKVIDLQKSNFSNLYYINYGYNLKKLNDHSILMHVFNRVHGNNPVNNKIITDTLDLESDIDSSQRKQNLIFILEEFLIKEISSINSEVDLKQNLLNRNHLNDIPLTVKEYFKLK